MVQIAPSLLSADFSILGQEIKKLEKAGADLIHLDVMDGHFVPNLTVGAPVIRSLRKATSLPFDVHLMMTNPEDFLSAFKYAGADRLTIHVELEKDIHDLLFQIRKKGMKAGISLRPTTPIETVFPYLEEVDLVLLMSVEPGFGGQVFIPKTTQRIKELKTQRKNLPFLIEVDGGINPETALFCKNAGADILVSGNYIFNTPSYLEAIESLKGEKNV
ncbi:MAG: ribulose-phosphate 3-epimerase [Alphaproteobacteria bacterium]|nr:ribulose-phosphate 3-epimerase [Alphaproteobacteria bacterium]